MSCVAACTRLRELPRVVPRQTTPSAGLLDLVQTVAEPPGPPEACRTHVLPFGMADADRLWLSDLSRQATLPAITVFSSHLITRVPRAVARRGTPAPAAVLADCVHPVGSKQYPAATSNSLSLGTTSAHPC